MTQPRYGFECENCGSDFDPISTRWRCTACGWKADCCNGAPLPPQKLPGDIRREARRGAADAIERLRSMS